MITWYIPEGNYLNLILKSPFSQNRCNNIILIRRKVYRVTERMLNEFVFCLNVAITWKIDY